jgi:oxalate decarboxylase/phosphoglucose isomerase-like protein (cupin superfamily)
MQFSSVETAVGPNRMGPAPHLHKDLDELMLVLEGTATVLVDGKVEEIQTGGWHMRPRGIEHTFWNGSNEPLRFVDMYFNQNFEDFLEELFHQIIPDMVKNNLTPSDPTISRRMDDLNLKFGVTAFPEKRQSFIDKYGLQG